MADVAFFLLGLASKPGGQVARRASPKILLLLNLIIRLVAFQSGMVARLEPGLEKPVCRHEPSGRGSVETALDSVGQARCGLLVVSSCLDLCTGNAWSFSPFGTVRFTRSQVGKSLLLAPR